MEANILSEEQKNKILDLFFNTKIKYAKIADVVQTSIEQVYYVIEEYCKENNYKTIRRCQNGIKFEKQTNGRKIGRQKSLKNVQEIKKWADRNKMKPRTRIEGISAAKEGEEETEEQEEIRLGQALKTVKRFIIPIYEGRKIEEIENEEDREIVRVVRMLDEKYEDNRITFLRNLKEKKKIKKDDEETSRRKINLVQKLGNEKMGKMIINLIKTKNATQEQVKTIAEFYGVDLEKVVNSKEER